MLNGACIQLALCVAAATTTSLAQCRFPADGTGRILAYAFEPTVTTASTTLHVNLTFRGANAEEELEIPTEWAGEKLHGVINLHALSRDTIVVETASPGTKLIRHTPNQEVVLAYDVVEDWTGRFTHPAEFHGVLLPEYMELNGDNALIHPKLSTQAQVTVHFDWQKLPAAWVLATSFGAGFSSDDRCQFYSGPWSAVQQALFTAGEFRVHRFRIGVQPAILAIRGEWTFSDEEVIADIQKAVGVVRDFWHDDRFPYFLVTLKPFDSESGNGDGSAFTNAYWLYLSRRDSISDQLPTLIHETFHAWDPRRMGIPPPGEWDAIEWFREGFVTYYGYLLAFRAQLIQLPAYLESVNRDLRSFAVSTSGYVRGRVIALWLDQRIRRESGGRNSLDTVMYDMVREVGKPLTQARILETAGRYLSAASRAQLAHAIEPGSSLPTVENALGLCARGSVDEVQTFDLGFDLNASMAAGSVTGLEAGGPAFLAGLRNGQRLSGRLSVYNNQPDKAAIVTIQTSEGRQAVEYYPRGKPIAAMQYHLERQAYTNPDGCQIK